MTRRIKRTDQLEITLVLHDENFIRPPRDAQRNALLNRALHEFVLDLQALDHLSARFVPGLPYQDLSDRRQKELRDEEIMEDWQLPLMEAMARIVSAAHGDVLEIGFGRGVASELIQQGGVRSHTIIECNDSVVQRFHEWRRRHPDNDIRLVHGLWQDTIEELGTFDAVFFHTYPLDEAEYMKYVHGSVTFAAHFFPVAARHLVPGGVFTYLSNEIDSLSRAHQRALFRWFEKVELQVLPLDVPPDVRDTWWADRMVVVRAEKGAAQTPTP